MIIPLLPEYAEGILPEEMKDRIARHLKQCPACHKELQFYEETASFIHSPTLSTEYQGISISDRVMARILEENKWASPALKQDAGVSTLRRRIILVLAAVLFVLFMIPIVTSEQASVPPPSSSEIAATDRIVSSDQFLLPPDSRQEQKIDESSMTYGVIASARNPIVYGDVSSEGSTSVNYGLLSAIFGILVIVVGMGWVSRLKDKRK